MAKGTSSSALDLRRFQDEGGIIIGVDVDTQKDFADKTGSLFVPAEPSVRENIAALSSTLRIQIGSVDAHAFDAWEFQLNGGLFPPHCVKGTEGWLKIPETQKEKRRFIPMSTGNVVIGEHIPGEGNRPYGPKEFAEEVFSGVTGVFEKEVYSLFANPNADPYVQELVKVSGGVRNVLFAVFGYASGNYCVDAAAEGLKSRGYQTAIIQDASAPIDIGHDGKPQDGQEVTKALAEERQILLLNTGDIIRV